MPKLELHAPFEPAGDQPTAIATLVEGLQNGKPHQVLLGITGSGKTMTIANVINEVKRPTLVLSHNKTLAAQLYGEFKKLFPNNAVEYFVSYFDYYQPEAYVAATDTYIEKDSMVNERIDKLRHAATRSLLTRQDVIIVASVSCIYGLGSPEAYNGMMLRLDVGMEKSREDILRKLVDIQYSRNEMDFKRGTFRARGDVIEIFPAHAEDQAIRVELWGDEIEAISLIDPLRGVRIEALPWTTIFPASHYVTPQDRIEKAVDSIRTELQERLQVLHNQGKLLEAQRLEQRCLYDLEMIAELGYCSGIENYSRHLTGAEPGAAPPNLLSYFPKDWLLVVDESHVAVPQVRGMYKGDRSRKENLVRHGFRLPSALDNRPLKFEEFFGKIGQAIYVSATPAPWELEMAGGEVAEQIIRPTGLLDPVIEVRPATTEVDDLLEEIRITVEAGWRVLVTCLTKRMAQELTDYYRELGVRVRYLHSDIDTLDRLDILQDLRAGEFDVLVGINLLREGLDIPEVALVGILDADKEGYLRSRTSLIQTIGRAARNVNGRCILYANKMTPSMKLAIGETERRREAQQIYNTEHGITPQTIIRSLESPLAALLNRSEVLVPKKGKNDSSADVPDIALDQIPAELKKLRLRMKAHSSKLQFEEAAKVRDELRKLEAYAFSVSGAL